MLCALQQRVYLSLVASCVRRSRAWSAVIRALTVPCNTISNITQVWPRIRRSQMRSSCRRLVARRPCGNGSTTCGQRRAVWECSGVSNGSIASVRRPRRGSCRANPRRLKMSDIDAGERKPPALPPKPIRASASDEAEPRTATPEPGSQPPAVPPKPVRSSLTGAGHALAPVLPRFQTIASSCPRASCRVAGSGDSCSFR